MKPISVTAALLASALALAGCNRGAAPANNSAAPKPAETNTPAPAPAPADNEAAAGEEAAGPTASVATARQNFSVVNGTGHTVMTLNVSPATEEEWGPDILGTDVLQNGQTAQVVFDRAETQCNYDLRATYDDGDTSEMRGVNLCQTATVRLVAE
jgi:FtsP/CotA-like multicopper oxidase with cupredoxin domain